MLSAAMLSLSLLAPAVPAMVDPGPQTCSTPTVDVTTVVDLRSAPAGGTFWLRQADFATRLAGELHLLDDLGNELVAADVRRTLESVSLSVPAGALEGDGFALLEDGAALGVQLAVLAAPNGPAAATLTAVVLGPTEADPCPEAFCSSTGAIPRVQLVDVSYSGGPALLDVAATAPEEIYTDLTRRSVDSMSLPAVAGATTVRVLAGPARSTSAALDVHVRLTSIDDRTLLDEELVLVAETADPPDGAPPPACQDGFLPRDGGCVERPFGCGVDCPPAVALLLAPLGLRRARYRSR